MAEPCPRYQDSLRKILWLEVDEADLLRHRQMRQGAPEADPKPEIRESLSEQIGVEEPLGAVQKIHEDLSLQVLHLIPGNKRLEQTPGLLGTTSQTFPKVLQDPKAFEIGSCGRRNSSHFFVRTVKKPEDRLLKPVGDSLLAQQPLEIINLLGIFGLEHEISFATEDPADNSVEHRRKERDGSPNQAELGNIPAEYQVVYLVTSNGDGFSQGTVCLLGVRLRLCPELGAPSHQKADKDKDGVAPEEMRAAALRHEVILLSRPSRDTEVGSTPSS